jgi:hypothetical protein
VFTTILEERGYFWWHGTAIPDGNFAPESAVPGVLKIEPDGRSVLELDDVMSSDKPFSALEGNGKPLGDDRGIQGILKAGNQYVLLTKLHKSGSRFSSRGISFERFTAYGCLVGRLPLPSVAPLEFNCLRIDLRGFDGWLRLGPIKLDRNGATVTAEHVIPDSRQYDLEDGTVVLDYDIDATHGRGSLLASHLELTTTACISYTPHADLSPNGMQIQFNLIADLLILLTGSEYALAWPELLFGEKHEPYRYYFVRQSAADEPPAPHETVTNFPQLKDTFGRLLSTWRKKRDDFGPGFYLYLGTRRGMKLYEEHRFVNLIWGLESLHRKRHSTRPVRGKLTLAQRLVDVFKCLPFDIADQVLHEFCSRCAELRNEISHHGGPRKERDPHEFIMDLGRRNQAISHLYHALLLREIGVDDQILRYWVYSSFNSYGILFSFVEAGLLPPSVLDRSTESAPAPSLG